MNEYDLGPCGSCAQAQECLGRLTTGAMFKTLIGEFALGPELDSDADGLYSAFQAIGVIESLEQLEDTPVQTGEELVRLIRKYSANILETADENIEADEALLGSMTAGCEGPLKMRAKKAGRTITATICNSPQAADGLQKEIVITERSRKN